MSNEEEIKKALESGRTPEDVAADLADDGVLNESNITGVLAVKENTSAIDKATEAAQKLHKLIAAIVPILLLISTMGLELTGVIDVTPAGEGDDWVWDEGEHSLVWGCTDYYAENYDEYATDDDGSCNYPPDPIVGCTDHEANNYDEYAEEDDGSCEYDPEPIEGCTDDTANNYDAEAEEDDGSCEYDPEDCDPFFYSASATHADANNTVVEATFDIDCHNMSISENVQVQFLAWTNGTDWSNSDGPFNWTYGYYNITGEEWDEHTLILGNFTNDTYDLYIYLIREDGSIGGERKYLNTPIQAGDE